MCAIEKYRVTHYSWAVFDFSLQTSCHKNITILLNIVILLYGIVLPLLIQIF